MFTTGIADPREHRAALDVRCYDMACVATAATAAATAVVSSAAVDIDTAAFSPHSRTLCCILMEHERACPQRTQLHLGHLRVDHLFLLLLLHFPERLRALRLSLRLGLARFS